MNDKPWVLTWNGKPCRIAKRCRLSTSWDINRAMWFRDEDEFYVWLLSRFAERGFEGMHPWTKLKVTRKTWWRLWLWGKFNRFYSINDSWFKRLELQLFYFIEQKVSGER